MKIFENTTALAAATLTAGQIVRTKGYSLAGDGGGATYLIKTAVDYAGTPDEYGDHSLANGNIAVLQTEGSVNVKLFGATGDGVTDDTVAIQAAIDAVEVNGKLLIPVGTYLLTSSITLPQRISITGENKFGASITGNFDGALFSSGGQLWRNTIENLSLSNQNAGVNAACISATCYQVTIQNCTISANSGYGIRLLGGAYSVENEIRSNYFNGCKYGIYAQTGTHSNTDAYVIDNYFYGNGFQTNGIYWDIASGSTFRGNHFYGGASRYFMELVGGLNVSVSDTYFEQDSNPRVRLSLGNPGSYSFVGNKFWGGDGSTTDFNGDQSSLIAVSFSLYNPSQVTFSGNIFEGGSNAVPIFNLLNASALESSKLKVLFDSSNLLNGDVATGAYSLAISGASGTNTNLKIVVAPHPEFNYYSTAQSTSPSSVACSQFFQKNSGFATGYPSLPTNKGWLNNQTVRINNIGTTHTMSFSTGATGGITGNVASPNQIPPGGVADLMLVDSNYYFLHLV